MSDRTIGRYQIQRELGRGGMATVYLAYDPVLERDVALKLLPNYFAHDPEFSARFEREAKTVASLEHTAIVSMYDYGEDGEWPYFVMQLMKGGSLKERIGQGPMDLANAAHIMRRIAGALDKAHRSGIVHRDLKPGNVLFDEDGEPYLSDFGIVKLAESAESYTRTGNTLGTPAYMSPEQADGKPDIDGRSDVYALGILLYEMLTGATPFVHDSMPRLLVMHLTSPIPNILEARPDLPPALQTVIEKAMAKEPDERYATAGELAAALQAVLAAPAVPPPAASPQPVENPVQTETRTPQTAVSPTDSPAPQTAAPAAQAARPEKATPQPDAPIDTDPAPPKQEAPQSAPAKSGGIPTWAYAVAGVVVLALIVVFAWPDGDDGAQTGQVIETGDGADTAVNESARQPTAGSRLFDDADRWDDSQLIPGDDFFINNGNATFATRILGFSWISHKDTFGPGVYELDVVMPDVALETAAVGMIFLYSSSSEDWVEFIIDNAGMTSAADCRSRCDTFDELFRSPIPGGRVTPGQSYTLKVEFDGAAATFYVNDEQVGSSRSTPRRAGQVGLILYNDVDQDLSTTFANFRFTPVP